jgi:hypothetical protein
MPGIPAGASVPTSHAGAVSPSPLRSRLSEVEVQIVFGFQTRRKRTRQTIELIAAMTSTSSGPM